MSQTQSNIIVRKFRTGPMDIGVAVVVIIALAVGLFLRYYVDNSTSTYTSDLGLRFSYPSTWRTVDNGDGTILHVEDPTTDSAYKTNVTIESRDLDPGSPPTLQELVDRRVQQHSGLASYHFLTNTESNVAGARAEAVEYAYVVQPIDVLRTSALPVVVHTREYIVVSNNRTFYITLSAPDNSFDQANGQFDRMIQTAAIQ
jgi:hypothetical protein